MVQAAKILFKIIETEDRLKDFKRTLKVNCREIDLFQMGHLTGTDILNYMNRQSFFPEEAEVNLFIFTWDWDQDGKLAYQEFLNWAEVRDSEEQSSSELTQMMYLELNMLAEIEADKYRLNSFQGFTVLDLFLSIERNLPVITLETLGSFLQKEGYLVDEAKLTKLILRICRSTSKEISYFEFADFFLYNKAYFSLREDCPDLEISPLSLNYSIYKSIIESSPERSEIFSGPQKQAENSPTENEENLEKLKIKLALRKDFTIKGLFKWFAGKKKTVNKTRLEKGAKRLGFFTIDNFLKEFDRDFDEELEEEDFSQAFAPKTKGYRLLLQNRARQSIPICEETMEIVNEVLKFYC